MLAFLLLTATNLEIVELIIELKKKNRSMTKE